MMTLRMIRAVAVAAAAAAPLLPAPAQAAGGCEVLRVPAERAECVARERARDEARAEVQRQMADRPAGAEQHRPGRWGSRGAGPVAPDADELIEPRLIAAVGGLLWFFVVARARWRARTRARV